MKKSIVFIMVLFLTMGGTMVFAANESANVANQTMTVPVSESKLMQTEVDNMRERLDEIRDMDKAEMNSKDKKEIKKELKEMKKMKKASGGIYIGVGTLLIAILLIAILV